MLNEFVHKFVPGRLPATVLLLHGSGGDENDLLPVARALVPGAAFLSPRGKVLDQGLRRFFLLDRSDVRERTAELAEWIGEAVRQYQIDPARLYALGYSNGANIAAVLMLLHPGSIAGACLFRSRAMVDPATLPSLEGVPVLISAGQTEHLITTEDADRLVEDQPAVHVALGARGSGNSECGP